MNTPVQQKQIKLDAKLLQVLQDGTPEWKSRLQIQRLMGVTLNTTHFNSLNRLELEELIEIRQSRTKKGRMCFEYRAKDKG